MDAKNTSETAPERTPCRNCGKKLAKKGDFCPHCGQKSTAGIEPFRKLLARFWKSATHLDNKFVTMCGQLFVPAKVTQAWAAGRVKKYPHPVQFFFVAVFFFLLVIGNYLKDMRFKVAQDSSKNVVVNFGFYDDTDTTSIHGDLYKSLEHYVHKKNFKAAYEGLPADMKTPAAQNALDSVLRNTTTSFDTIVESVVRDATKNDTIIGSIWGRPIRLDIKDIVAYEPREIARLYGLDDFFTRLAVFQMIKSLKDPVGLVRHFMGSLAWTVLSYITIISFLMTMLYWRQGRYYVEHFVFLLHRYSAILLLFAAVLALKILYKPSEWLMIPSLLWAMLFLPFALKRYYQQNWGITLLKTVILWITGLIALVMLFSFGFIFVAMFA